MYHSFGWAQMQCHGDLILKLYSQARGRASEFLGEDYIVSDKKILAFNLPELAREGYNNLDSVYRSCLNSFVNGMNEFAIRNPGQISEQLKEVLPLTPEDVIAHILRVTCLEFLAGEDIYQAAGAGMAGSNAISVAPSRSESGNSLLLINPHLPWYDFFTWFESHLNCGEFSAYGISLVGMPTLSMAFNNNLGWAHTVNPIDASDRYELTLKDGGYLFDGIVRQFTFRNFTIRVRQKDGTFSDVRFEVKYSLHGPVLGEKGDKAWAARVAGLKNYRIFEQYHKMAASKNIEEFESVLGMLQNPMFNVIYADRKGNILYLFNGDIPVRTTGDFSFWRGTIDGTDSRVSVECIPQIQ